MGVRLVFGAAAFVAAVVAGVSPDCAQACTCVAQPGGFRLGASQVAVVGVVESVRVEHPQAPLYSSADPTVVSLAVERDFNAQLPDRIEVHTVASTASCGISASEGQRIGLLLSGARGHWESGLCSQVSPETLLAGLGSKPGDGSSAAWFVLAVFALTGAGVAFAILVRGSSRRAQP
jgi:hypothetical protein